MFTCSANPQKSQFTRDLRLVVRDDRRWPGAGSRGPLRPSREPGRRLVDVELSKEDVRKELSLRILAQICKSNAPTCEKRRSTVAELVAGQPRGIDGLLLTLNLFCISVHILLFTTSVVVLLLLFNTSTLLTS